jgi:hypothetical protein
MTTGPTIAPPLQRGLLPCLYEKTWVEGYHDQASFTKYGSNTNSNRCLSMLLDYERTLGKARGDQLSGVRLKCFRSDHRVLGN